MYKVLIIKLGALGDVVRTSFLVNAYKEKNPSHHITWLTKLNAKELLFFNKKINKLLFVEDFVSSDFSEKYDLVFSLDDDIPEGLFNKIYYKDIVGIYIDNNEICYTNSTDYWFNMGLVSRFGKEKADQLKKKNKKTHTEIFSKIFNINYNVIRPDFSFSNQLSSKNKFKDNIYSITVNPFAGNRWPSKNLDQNKFRELLSKINFFFSNEPISCQFYIPSSPENINTLNSLRDDIDNIIIEDTSHSLQYLASMISKTNYVISTDSLILHLAVACNIPNLSFYTSTSADEIETFNLGVKLKSTSKDYCSYNPYADTSSITSDKLFNLFKMHYKKLIKLT